MPERAYKWTHGTETTPEFFERIQQERAEQSRRQYEAARDRGPTVIQSAVGTDSLPKGAIGKGAANGLDASVAVREAWAQSDPVRRCVDLKAEWMRSIRFVVQGRDEDGRFVTVNPQDLDDGTEQIRSNVERLQRLLDFPIPPPSPGDPGFSRLRRKKGHPVGTGAWFRYCGTQLVELAGNFPGRLVRLGSTRNRLGLPYPEQIWTVHPDAVEPLWPEPGDALPSMYRGRKDTPQGKAFKSKFPNGVSADDMIHLLLPNPLNPWWGTGREATGAETSDLSVEAPRHKLGVLRNSAKPSMIVAIKGLGQHNAREWGQWRDQHLTGPANAGKAFILPGDQIDVKSMSYSPMELGLNDDVMQAWRVIAARHGVPLPLAIYHDTKFKDLEAHRFSFHRDTMIPYAWSFAQALTIQLVPEFLDEREWRIGVEVESSDAQRVVLSESADRMGMLHDRGIPWAVIFEMFGLSVPEAMRGDWYDRSTVGVNRMPTSELGGFDPERELP